MVRVGSKELKNRFGKYLAMVRDGQAVEVTDRGRPVARIIPAGPGAGRASETIVRLASMGLLRIGSGTLGAHKPAVLKKGASITKMLREERR